MKTIAIFGSSYPKPDEQDYIEALAVGRVLGQAGYTVMTGGYKGVMEAASRGAFEAGAHVVGVTCAEIEAFRTGAANAWVKEEVKHATLHERVQYLVIQAQAYIVMPGGVGTLHELAMTWEMMRIAQIPLRPIVCYGAMWQGVLRGLLAENYIPEEHKTVIRFATAPEHIIAILREG